MYVHYDTCTHAEIALSYVYLERCACLVAWSIMHISRSAESQIQRRACVPHHLQMHHFQKSTSRDKLREKGTANAPPVGEAVLTLESSAKLIAVFLQTN